jgi:peptidoglycan/LPS O-acetylase OafA/YrhL
VEWFFYLIFPLLLAGLAKLANRRLAIGATIATSLVMESVGDLPGFLRMYLFRCSGFLSSFLACCSRNFPPGSQFERDFGRSCWQL